MIYEYFCNKCKRLTELVFSLAEYNEVGESQYCDRCKKLMIRHISPVALKTTTRFMSGSNDGLPDDASRKIAYAKAREAGVSVTGMKFHPGLCPKHDPFSPKAWYRDEEDVKRKALALGRCVEGSVQVKAPTYDSDYASLEKPYRVARHVVADDVNHEIREVHGGRVSKQKREELFRKYQDKHSGTQKRGVKTLAPK